MSTLPEPPSNPSPTGPGDAGWQPLPPAAARVAAIGTAIFAVPAGVGLTVPGAVLLDTGLIGTAALGAVLVFGAATFAAFTAWLRTRRTRWKLDARGLQVRRGLVWRLERLVPRSRVQHLDIERGPIERGFGLATLVVHTAGTRIQALRQSGLREEDAVALRDALLPAGRDDDVL
ncbi:PH domain-containing protein [Arenimonas composti]|uniref:YdbS-like PH domain-containing protein n=1 Tax=Arenimonas composti TR7-09 = DSM 18010 TaxID=1121013 RepID=A0A091BZX8_9GAMM|nr:PH domain-containing protein [Arenimonas composti]KFN49900.1 hypothetical protein P873_08635 [Arenimonas composti TR7-09 = DSM 18010]